MRLIHWLGESECHRDSIVGGKAASLSRLAAAHRIPPGFALAAVPADGALPDAHAGAVREAYTALAARCDTHTPAVAVRSSALDEDGHGAAFAGQHDTYLNIRGDGAVLDAVLRCVRSGASEEAMAYRRRQGMSLDDVRIAVLVQQLVPSDVSAVAFSANPVTGDPGEIMINASWGLGESIVSGSVTPDTYVLRSGDMSLASVHVAAKRRMTVMGAAGTSEVDVPDHQQRAPALTDGQAREIAGLAAELQRALGHPVDIECAYAGGRLYLLQCRPITTLG